MNKCKNLPLFNLIYKIIHRTFNHYYYFLFKFIDCVINSLYIFKCSRNIGRLIYKTTTYFYTGEEKKKRKEKMTQQALYSIKSD